MKTQRILFAALLGLFASGCCTRYSLKPNHLVGLTYAEGGGEVVEHYQTQNYGWYLFDTIPLVCGDMDPEAKLSVSFFEDQVRMDLLTEDFNQHVRETNTRPVCVTMLNTDWVTFEVPGVSVPLILLYVICYREVQISALLLKKDEPETNLEVTP